MIYLPAPESYHIAGPNSVRRTTQSREATATSPKQFVWAYIDHMVVYSRLARPFGGGAAVEAGFSGIAANRTRYQGALASVSVKRTCQLSVAVPLQITGGRGCFGTCSNAAGSHKDQSVAERSISAMKD